MAKGTSLLSVGTKSSNPSKGSGKSSGGAKSGDAVRRRSTSGRAWGGGTAYYTAPVVASRAPSAPAALSAPTSSASSASLTKPAYDPAAAAAAQAAGEQAAARTAANNSARSGANADLEKLNAQITANQSKKATNDANLAALGKLVSGGAESHASVRDSVLKSLEEALNSKLSQITDTFKSASRDFAQNLRDNEASEGDDSFVNLANRAREKQDVVTQALAQGAGESDVLKSQLQALRNWNSNQAEINRSFFDTRASINAGISDLNNSVKTSMMNEESSTNTNKAKAYDDYYSAMSTTYSDMANLDQNNYLLQGEIDAAEQQKRSSLSLVEWLDAGKNAEGYQAPTYDGAMAKAAAPYTSQNAAKAAEMASSTWKNPGVSKATMDWKGMDQSEGTLTSTQVWNGQENSNTTGSRKQKRPEGATLRKW